MINIIMNPLHSALSLPNNVFKEDITVHSFPLTRRILIPNHYLNPDILKIINDAGLRIGQTELFYSYPNMVSGIHRDVPGNDISKINWIYYGNNSKMIWYDTDDNKHIDGPSNNKCKFYTLEESTLLLETNIHSPSLIQAAIAHNIKNFDEPRWVVSVMLFYKYQNKQCAYNDARCRLHNYLI